MTKRVWVGLSVAGAAVLTLAGGGIWVQQRGKPPTLSVAGAPPTTSPAEQAGAGPAATQVPKPVPLPPDELRAIDSSQASPARWESPEPTPAERGSGTPRGGNRWQTISDSVPPAPPDPSSQFSPFPESRTAAQAAGGATRQARRRPLRRLVLRRQRMPPHRPRSPLWKEVPPGSSAVGVLPVPSAPLGTAETPPTDSASNFGAPPSAGTSAGAEAAPVPAPPPGDPQTRPTSVLKTVFNPNEARYEKSKAQRQIRSALRP